MKLVDALRTGDTITENGMKTNSSSLNACVDLFFNIGAMRGQDKEKLLSLFSIAFIEDPIRALKILFWVRDVRGGAGERQIFKDIIKYLAKSHREAIVPNISYIPLFGRWDDLLAFEGTALQNEAFYLIKSALEDENGLCAKWMPRKGATSAKLRVYMKMSPKQYRKTIVNLTNVVETAMCSGEWNAIDYGKIPSVAAARYQKAFWKNDETRYSDYVESLKKGEAKINAGAIYPYDVIKSMRTGKSEVATEQWKILPDFMENPDGEMILPIVDVSGSMSCPAGGSKNVTCMDVALSLGLYISEKNRGPFKDAFITFSGNPELQILKGNLGDRLSQLSRANWSMNTNLEATFELILEQAKMHSLKDSDMPTKILILSDMEFDEATRPRTAYSWRRDQDLPVKKWNPSAQDMIAKQYKDAGYKMPQIVYWNIQSRNGGIPVSFDTKGTALVSGFSPSIMTSLLGGEIESPIQIMDRTILSERYEMISA